MAHPILTLAKAISCPFVVYLIHVPTVHVSVITPDGTLRNLRLDAVLSDLRKQFSFLHEYIFRGVDGRTGFFEDFEKINQSANSKILGREITTTEGACLFSHRNAYRECNSDWLVVIEDDMEIVNEKAFADLLGILQSESPIKQPVVLLIYVGKKALVPFRRSILVGKMPFFRALKIPTSTCAYVINAAARDVALRDLNFIGTADWPTWSNQVQFYLINDQIFRHLGEDNSLLADSTNQFRNVWPKFHYSIISNLKALTTGVLPATVGGRIAFIKLFTKPLLLWRSSKIPLVNFLLFRKNE